MGKTTLGTSLDDNGVTTRYLKIPNRGTEIGKVIDAYLKRQVAMNDTQAQLLFTANLLYEKEAIEQLLREGIDVVLDRYIPSAVVYYSHNMGTRERAWIETMNRGLPKPDLVIVLRLTTDDALWRINKREMMIGVKRERYDEITTHKNISRLFDEIYGGEPGVVFVNAGNDPDEVRAEVSNLIDGVSVEGKPLERYS